MNIRALQATCETHAPERRRLGSYIRAGVAGVSRTSRNRRIRGSSQLVDRNTRLVSPLGLVPLAVGCFALLWCWLWSSPFTAAKPRNMGLGDYESMRSIVRIQ
jgi:hypothetical protein